LPNNGRVAGQLSIAEILTLPGLEDGLFVAQLEPFEMHKSAARIFKIGYLNLVIAGCVDVNLDFNILFGPMSQASIINWPSNQTRAPSSTLNRNK